MNVRETPLPDLLIIEPDVFQDHRGRFLELWNQDRYPSLPRFVQDNLSTSHRGVLRGLHFQHPNPQGKLVTVVRGEVFDVAVDLRRGSPTFGQWWGTRLSAEDHRQLWIPSGFAHGFLSLHDDSTVSYKCTALYSPGDERTLRWDDSEVGIEWPMDEPELSEKDRAGRSLAQLEEAGLPAYADRPSG